MVLFEGAGPSLVGLLYGFFEPLALQDRALQDRGGQLRCFVRGGRQAALGRGDEPDGCIQADRVSEQGGNAPRFLVRGPQRRPVYFSPLCGMVFVLFYRGFSSARWALPSLSGFSGGWGEKARCPVMAWPTIRVFTSLVPS